MALSDEELQIIEKWLYDTMHYELPFEQRKCLQISDGVFLVVEKNTAGDEIIGYKTRLIRDNESIPIYGHGEFSYKNDEKIVIDKTLQFLKSL